MLAARSIPKPAFPVHDPHPDDPGRSGAYGTCCSELTNAPHGANFIAMATATERGPAARSHVPATAHDDGPSAAADARTHVKPYVQFQNIDKSYDGRTLVVQDLNLDIREGEFLTLLGPSGSGKTTCLMMLAGFETPSAGSIRIGGRSVHDLPPRQRNIGVVFQNYALFPHLSVGANLSFPLEVRRMAAHERRQRVRSALSLVRLQGFEERRPDQLSGGQQQRVAIARALVFEPHLVLMDEPLGALDRNLREEMQYEIRRIHRRLGVTIVYVTHDQQEAMVMSDRIAVFHDGRIEQVAPPEILYEEPERPFVARFIGGNNLVHGSVAAVDGDYCRVDVHGRTVVAYRVAECAPGDRGDGGHPPGAHRHRTACCRLPQPVPGAGGTDHIPRRSPGRARDGRSTHRIPVENPQCRGTWRDAGRRRHHDRVGGGRLPRIGGPH